MRPECENIRDQVNSYIEASLSEEQLGRIQRHIEVCADCRKYYEGFTRDDKMLGSFAEEMKPKLSGIADEIVDNLGGVKSSNKTYRFFGRYLRFAAAAVILLAIILGGVVFYGGGDESGVARTDSGAGTELLDSGNGVFVLNADPEMQIVQVNGLIEAGCVEALASILDRPLDEAGIETKLAAAVYLASLDDLRGIEALEEITAGGSGSGLDASMVSLPGITGSFDRLDVSGEESYVEPVEKVDGLRGKGELIAEMDARKALDGKKAIVRVYDDWQFEPERYKTAGLEIKSGEVKFEGLERQLAELDFDGAKSQFVVCLFGEDQVDPNVASRLANCAYTKVFRGDLCFDIPDKPVKEQGVTFRGAGGLGTIIDDFVLMGDVIPGAEVKVYLVSGSGEKICLGDYVTSEAGVLTVPNLAVGFDGFEFVFSHPEYGAAIVKRFSMADSSGIKSLVLPLVKDGSEESLRAGRGYVVDADGLPVAGAEVSCSSVRTLGEGLIHSSNEQCSVLTNEDGSFRFYIPMGHGSNDMGNMVPPKSRYSLRIEAPCTGLMPLQVEICNDEEYTITMAGGDMFRRFAFYDEQGLITDEDLLGRLNINVSSDNISEYLRLSYNDIKDGAVVPYGTYHAVIYDFDRDIKFNAIEVTPESDEVLVFELPDVIEFHGKVVDGITGSPMAGVLVFAKAGSKQKGLVELTDEDWRVLDSIDVDNPGLEMDTLSLDECYGLVRITRTDENGEYKMYFRHGDAYGVYAVKKDFLPVMQRDMRFDADDNNRCEIPVLKLFPASKIVMEMAREVDVSRSLGDWDGKGFSYPLGMSGVQRVQGQIWPWWQIERAGNPAWIDDLLKFDNGQDGLIEYAQLRIDNGEVAMFVPANTSLTVRLEPSDESMCPMLVDVGPLGQGEVKKIGKIIFPARFQIALKVVDAMGNAYEGVPVRRRGSSNTWGVVHNTDESGRTTYYVDPNAVNVFGVICHSEDRPAYTEEFEVVTTTAEDTPLQFTIMVSDKLLEMLFGD